VLLPFPPASKSRLDRPLILPSYHLYCLVFFLPLPLLVSNPPNPFFLTHSATSISAHCKQFPLHVLSRPLYKVKSSRASWTSSTPLPQLTPHQAQHRPRYVAVLRFHNQSSPIKTPHIDALAAKSTVFNSAYCASPLCAPARSSLVTAQLPTQLGAWDNASPLGCDVPTYAHYLRREGYETILAGKMHFIGEQLHGFEERLTTDIYPGDFGWYV